MAYKSSERPVFSVYLGTPVSAVTGDGTQYQIIYDTALVNVGSVYNLSTGIFTAPIAGNYCFSYTPMLEGVDGTNGVIQLIIIVTAFTFQASYHNAANIVDGGFGTAEGHCVVPMAVSDTCTFNLLVDGISKNVGLDAGSGFSYASGYLLQ